MRGEKFYEMLDMLDDNLVLESAEVKRKTWRRRLAIVGIVVGLIVFFWFCSLIPVLFPSEGVGDTEGIIQDGAYYVYAGSGFAMTETRVPQGIVRYVPGQGKELLVSAEEHPMDVLFPSWGVNSHGLYYLDMGTNQLRRQDLATGEETVLYTAPDTVEGQQMPESELSGLIGSLLNGEEPVMDYGVALFMDQVAEDTVSFTYRASDGMTSYAITVDSRTGEVLSQRQKTDADYDTTVVSIGTREVQEVRMEYPEGFTYPGWEQDVEMDDFYWTDVQENGQSILPPDTMGSVYAIPGGLVVGYRQQGRFDEDGYDLQYPTDYILLTETENLPVPKEAPVEEIWCVYQAYFDGWLYYQSDKQVTTENGVTLNQHTFEAVNLATGERVPLLERSANASLVSDGTWFYFQGNNHTDCYRLERDDTGRPLALVLVEENI